ncbi:MAG: asparagine synthase (glutamine-hydrolyzing) [Phycisphaeraceae bacterium]|nr:asparagine synthase (glutamine-hydrolyzing) [Phycisphaeraceae bacterium]
MCGICGIYRKAGAQRKELEAMCRSIAHRGPDDEGYFVAGPVGLGHRRLSIIDLSGGHQPLTNEDGSIWIVFNGEIYNYPDLRRMLQDKGHVFKTHTDTEVIVHLYEELGDKCVQKLVGMFAFAIWDQARKKLLLARDHIGQKPLFYRHAGGELIFASELKGILAADGVARQMDVTSLHHYLSLRFIPPPGTMIRGIQKLPPAHYLTFAEGKIHIHRYWNMSFQDKLHLDEDSLLKVLDDRLSQTVHAHLISDVPVGAFLSGGMDSSMMVALMARHQTDRFNTFSVGVKEQDFNELPYARVVAERYGTQHIEEIVKSDLIELLPKMIWHLDEPSDPISACMFHAAELASRHVKVVLGGDGGDELFAGFDRYVGQRYVEHYSHIPVVIRRAILGPLLNQMRDSFTYKSLPAKLRWLHQLSTVSGAGRRYAEATCFTRFNHDDKQQLFGADIWQELESVDSSLVIAEPYDKAPAQSPIDRMLYADYQTRLPEHTLMLTDRMTMAHGLEARSPLVDHQLVEFMASMPSQLKIRGRTLKYVLRKLAEKYLPAQIINRPKQGFMFPVAYWFRHELGDFLEQSLQHSSLVRQGLWRGERIKQLIAEHRGSRVDHHVRLWMLLNVELWHRMYIDGEDRQALQEEIKDRIGTEVSA